MERYKINTLSRREFLQESAMATAALGLTIPAYAQDANGTRKATDATAPLRIGGSSALIVI